MNIPISKATKELQVVCRELIAERNKLQSKAAETLVDDRGTLDKAAENLANLRAREEVVLARLPRRRADLYESFCKDLAQMCEAALAKVQSATMDLRQAKADFRERVMAEHSKGPAEKILNDSGLVPKSIARAQSDLDQARLMLRDAAGLRGRIDKVKAEEGALTRAVHISGESYIKPLSFYYTNAKQYLPELAD